MLTQLTNYVIIMIDILWSCIIMEVFSVDKNENVKFYTEKCGFDIQSVEMDGNVKVYRFILER